MSDEFCIIHGKEHMKSLPNAPLLGFYCVKCEKEDEKIKEKKATGISCPKCHSVNFKKDRPQDDDSALRCKDCNMLF